MRRLTITENFFYGAHSHFVVETSAGVRATGATLESALSKLVIEPPVMPDELHAVARIFKTIRPSNGRSQIHKGQAGA